MTLKTRWSHLFLLLCCVQTCLCQSDQGPVGEKGVKGEFEECEFEECEFEEYQGPVGEKGVKGEFEEYQGPVGEKGVKGEFEECEFEECEFEEYQGPVGDKGRPPLITPETRDRVDGNSQDSEALSTAPTPQRGQVSVAVKGVHGTRSQSGSAPGKERHGVDGNPQDSEALSNGPTPLTGIPDKDGVEVRPQDKEFLSSHLTTVFLPIIYIIVFAVGLPTNAMAIWVFLFRTKKKRASSIYMANLALADLLFVIWVPLKISYHFNGNNWIYGEGLCKVLVAFFYSNMYCSIAFITCISVQRYWAVVHPLSAQQRDNRIPVAVSVTVWVVVWLITIPLYLYDQQVRITNFNPQILTCHDVTRESQVKISAGYFLTMGTLGFVVPTIVCIISYILMLKALRNSMTDAAITKKRRKAVVLMITVLVMFLVCFTPSNIMLLVHYILLLGEANKHLYRFYITTLCLASLNSCIDPFVYYFISKNFRDHVKNTFLCRSERTVKRMKVSFRAPKNSQEQHTTPKSGNTQSTEC